MWPWEHVVFAYLLFSLGCRVAGTSPPSGPAIGLLILGAVLPDLVDKPLAWQWDVFAAGYGAAHSLFVAVPISIAVIMAALRLTSPLLGAAFVIGYLSHLAGDLLSWHIRYREVPIRRVLWPLLDRTPSSGHGNVLEGIRFYLGRSLTEVRAGDPDHYLLVQLLFLLLAAGLWIVDGMPGVR